MLLLQERFRDAGQPGGWKLRNYLAPVMPKTAKRSHGAAGAAVRLQVGGAGVQSVQPQVKVLWKVGLVLVISRSSSTLTVSVPI